MPTDYDAPRVSTSGEDADQQLKEVQALAANQTAQQPKVDQDEAEFAESFELPGADLSSESLEITVEPQHRDEFVCSHCYLVHHRSQLAEASAMTCRDCA
jgi:hypothetical protein